MINGHGNNIYQYDKEAVEADFSSNIAFNKHAAKILSFLKDNMDSLCNYPDPMAVNLTERIATYHAVDTSQVLVTNGSAEAFYLVAHYLSNSASGQCRTAITTPSFAEYEDSCTLHNHQISYVDLREAIRLNISNLDSLWLASPNNPDGYRVPISDIYALAATNRGCKIILDRAYNDLSSDGESCCDLPENVLLIESFTKFYGIPGLRLGYIVASPEIIASLTQMRPPWSVNSLSLCAGEYILTNLEALRIDLDELIGESVYLQNAINDIAGFRVEESKCNFFLLEITNGKSASQLYDYLLEEHGLLIRNCSNFKGLSGNYVRIAAQQRSSNDKLIKALQQWK